MKLIQFIKKQTFILCQTIVFTSFVLNLNAGTPHSVGGSVTYSGGGSPSSATFNAYITSRPGEVLTQSSSGCGYVGGSYYVQCGNFPTSWSIGDVFHIDLNDGMGGSTSGEITLTEDPVQQLNLVISTPDIDISPTSASYGNVLVGENSTQGFTVSNTGGATLNVSSTSITGTDPGEFTITSGEGSFSLSPGANRTVNVQFHPSSTGSKSASLRIDSDDPDEDPLEAPLSGTGVLPDISASPNPANYGNVNVDSYSDVTITVSNSGSGNLNISSTSISGPDASIFTIQSGGGGATVTPGGTRNIVVRFSPVTTGAASATLAIASNDPDENPYNVTLSGTGVAPDISASPNPAAFGNVNVGSTADITVVVSNGGSANLDITSTSISGAGASSFSIQSGEGAATVAPGGTRNIVVRFSPVTTGAVSATLAIASNDPDENPYNVSLTGTGVAPDIAISPTSANYGNVLVGENSSQGFSVSNTGNTTLNVSGTTLTGTDATEFTITSGGGAFSLAPGGNRTINVQFHPSSAGSKSAALRINSDDPDENPLDAPLSGTGVVPDISASPNPANYGNVNVDSYSDVTIIVSNSGTGNLNISSTSISGPDASRFVIQSGGGVATVTPGGTRNIVVRFSPVATGAASATLAIASNDPDTDPYNVSLTGTGVAPDISASPNPANYGNVNVDSYSDITINVSNSGNGNLDISSTTISGPDAARFEIQSGGGAATMAPGGTRNIVVRFSPVATGAASATLAIASNDPDENPYNVTLSGTGVAPDISATPYPAAFGDVNVGSTSDITVVVSNSGTANLDISSTSISGAGASSFNIQSGGGAATVTPGGTRNIVVRFSPSATGAVSATLAIASNDPDENPYNVSLTGTGVAPDIAISPTSANYGNVLVGENSSQSFTVTNDGNANLDVTATSITGTDAAEFTITSGGGSFTLTPGGTHEVNVQFHPSSAGSKSAALRINSDDPDEDPLDAALSGTGVVPDISASPNPANYGNVNVNSYLDVTITVSNSGTGNLNISSTSISGPDASRFVIQSGGGTATVAPGGTRNIVVRFSPVATGAASATLAIASNDPDENPYNVSLTGTGVAPDISASPNPANYGDINVGSYSDVTITVSNSGNGNLNITSTTISGAGASSFAIQSGGGAATVAPAGTRNIVVRFSPAAIGAASATLAIASNDPDTDPYNVSLTGTGVAPDISASPNPANYGNVNVGTTADITVVVSNDGTANLEISSTSISGAGASSFSIQSGEGAATVAPGGTRNIVVRFSPVAIGAVSATLAIVSNDPDENPYNVSLTGTGVAPDISISPTSANYGNVLVGENSSQSFTVTNNGNESLNVSGTSIIGADATEFTITSGGGAFFLTPGGNRTINVQFQPSSAGSKSAALRINSNDPDEDPLDAVLSGTGVIPDISASPNPANYGNVNVDSYSDVTIIVSNSGTGNLNISSTSISGPDASRFVIQSGGGVATVAPGGTHNIVVRFSPVATGAASATLAIASNDPDENPYNISLTGTGVAPDISASPNPASYGNVNVGSTSDITITMSNSGNGNLNISSTAISGAGASSFTIQSGGGAAAVAPGGTRDIVIRFSPGAIGTFSATLVVASDDPDENPYNVSLTGTGVAPDISASPNPANYGNVSVGSTSDITVVVSNDGTANLNISSTSITGAGASHFNIQSGGGAAALAPGAGHDIIVRFSPTTSGATSASLSIASNDPDENPYNVTLTGTGVAPDIAVTPTSGVYGSVVVGENSTQSFTVTNNGNANLDVTATSIMGTDAGDFTITSGGGSFTLTPGGTRAVNVQFHPSSAGSKSATLRINSNDPNENPLDVPLSGAGIIPDISVSPASADYGDIELGDNATESFVVTNTGSADLAVSSTSLTGTNAGEFAIISGGGSFTLIPGANRTISVRFTPSSAGAKVAALTISSNDPDEDPLDIALAGNCIVIPDISVSPTFRNYGDVMAGASSTQTFTITNTGTGDLSVSSTFISGTDAGDFNIISGGGSFTIAPSANHPVQVQFSPLSLGSKSATFTIISDDPDEGSVLISLTGNGVATPVPDIWVEPSSYDYGDVPVDSTGKNTFVVSNNGTADLIISNIYLDGPDSSNFSIEEITYPVTLVPGNSFDIEVSFAPDTVGAMSAGLNLESNDSDTETLTVPLTGTGFILDLVSPYMVFSYPNHGAMEVIRNTSLQIKLADDEDGLNINTLYVSINDSVIVSEGIDQTEGAVSISCDMHYCNIYYTPVDYFPASTSISVNVRCEDVSPVQNEMDSTFSFNTGRCAPIITVTSLIDSIGGTVSDISNDLEINIPENALEDSVYITIGIIESLEDLPALPDTIDGIGLAYYFGPAGIHFNEPVTISIPYTEEDLDDAGITDPLDMPVFYFSTTMGEWIILEVIDYDDDYLYVEVTEFCYVVFGGSSVTGLEDLMIDGKSGYGFSLYQNYPNPVVDNTTISFYLPKASYVILRVYDINFRITEVVLSRQFPAGEFKVIWNADSYESGIYFYQLQIEGFAITRKMIVE
jgi:hypothetical protein